MIETQPNPLLDSKSGLPFNAIPFDKIKNQDFLPAMKTSIEQAHSAIAELKDNSEQPDFANTIDLKEWTWITLYFSHDTGLGGGASDLQVALQRVFIDGNTGDCTAIGFWFLLPSLTSTRESDTSNSFTNVSSGF